MRFRALSGGAVPMLVSLLLRLMGDSKQSEAGSISGTVLGG